MKGSKFLKRVLLLTMLFLVAACCLGISVSAAAAAPAEAANLNPGLAYLGAALSTGLAAIGGGIAVGNGAPAAIGALTEDPKTFSKSLIFVALGEGIALYGMLISILILNNA